MNLAQHALKAILAPPAGVSKKASYAKKSAKERMLKRRDDITEWVNTGATAVMISERLDLSPTSFWKHINQVIAKPIVLRLRENGGKSATGLKLAKRSPFD